MKILRKIITVFLAAALVIGFVPITELKYGEGVQAATAQEIIDDALSWAVQLDEYGKMVSSPIVKYKYGGLDLNEGVDCSGFVCAIFNRHGLDLVSLGVRSSYDMLNSYSKFGVKLDTTDVSAIKSGDILVTNGGGHVGIAWINGDTPMFIHSMNYGTGVVVQTLESYTRSSGIVAIIRPNAINGVKVNPIKGPGPLTTTNYGDTTVGSKDDPNAFAYDNPGAPFSIPTSEITNANPDAVKWIQKSLNNVINSKLTIDGVLNEKTVAEIKVFQKKYGYKETGKADTTVINKLVALHTAANKVTSLKLYLKRADAKLYVPSTEKETSSTDKTDTEEKKENTTESVSMQNKASNDSSNKSSDNSVVSDEAIENEEAIEEIIEDEIIEDEIIEEEIIEDEAIEEEFVDVSNTLEEMATDDTVVADKTSSSDSTSKTDSTETTEEDPNELVEVSDLELKEDNTVTLIAKYVPETAKNVTITWTSSNKDVVKVSEKGELVAVDGGEAEITAKVQEKITAKVKVKVIASIHRNEWRNGKWYNYAGEQTYKPRGEWKSNYSGIWYQDTSGWYPTNQWQKIDGKWYYFNSSGYAYKNGWSSVNGTWYYFRSSGVMAENEWINGYWLSSGGAWSYQYTGSWKLNSTGWWYEDTAGWYPTNETVRIDAVDYYFNSNGYWEEK